VRVLSTLRGVYCGIDTAPVTGATAVSQTDTPTIEGWECPASLWLRPDL